MMDERAPTIQYSNTVPMLLRFAFALLIFCIPFETVETPYTTGMFSIAKIAGWFFLLVAAFYPKNAFAKTPYIVWMFLLYLTIYFVYGMYQDEAMIPLIIDRTQTILQMIIFLWVAQNLLGDEVTAHITLLALGASTGLMALLQMLGITASPMTGAASRVTALAEDPNSQAAVSALGFLSLLGLAYFSPYKTRVLKVAVFPVLALILISIVNTESRTGILGLTTGLFVFMINKQGKHAIAKNIAVTATAVFVVAAVTLSNPDLYKRFERSFYSGNLAKREKILPIAIEMVREKPLQGWGPFTNTTELGARMNLASRDTHNLFLLILTEVGILGSLPYIIALGGCTWNAWRARSRLENVLPLALLGCLFFVNMGITWHNRKLHWFVLAYCFASFPYKDIRTYYGELTGAGNDRVR